MATYRLSAKIISRGKGQSAVAAAAYRSGEALRNERDGELKDYSARDHAVLFNGIFAPQDAPEWARDREQLWNKVELGEKRKDAQLAREFQLNLPHEMTDQQREWLLKDFVREQFTRRGYVVDAAIHAPDREGDARNFHAHLMVTLRTIGPDGFALTKDRELNSKDQLSEWREHWAHLTNHHLERHNIRDAAGNAVTVDHRSNVERGLDAEPTKHEGNAVTALARRGIETDRRRENDEIRERNTARNQLAAYAALKAGELAADLAPAAPAPGRDEDERPHVAPQSAPAAGLDHDWTSRAGMVAQQASAAIWARDAANRPAPILAPQRPAIGGDEPTHEATSRQQAEERQHRAASPVQTVADQLERRTEDTPTPGAAPVKSAQEIAREKYLAAFDNTHAKNVQEREQGRDGGRELDR